MHDLREIPTDVLMDELDRRSIAFVCAITEMDDDRSWLTRWWSRGNPVIKVGLGALLADAVRQNVTLEANEKPEDDD
jgi:hypothetical protein